VLHRDWSVARLVDAAAARLAGLQACLPSRRLFAGTKFGHATRELRCAPINRQARLCRIRVGHSQRIVLLSALQSAVKQKVGYDMTISKLAKDERERLQPAALRIARYDWDVIGSDLGAFGAAVLDKLLTPVECQDISALYPREECFRSHIHMARHGFGRGEYRYFKYPLPSLIADLRTTLYSRVVVFANEWNARMNIATRYPNAHSDYLKICHCAGQMRPTPLLLQYGPGDYNCLHQDLYGDLAFPLQVTVLLSEPNRDFTGGEFVLTEQRPRMQSRVEVVPLRQGDAVLFAVHNRPIQGTKGAYRVNLRHGVSRVRSGQRHTLGIIFHDAK
jgi:hypothetical protein